MTQPTRHVVRQGDSSVTVDALPDGRIQVEGAPSPFSVEDAGNGLYLVSDGTSRWRVAVAGPPDARVVSVEGRSALLDITAEGAEAPRKKRRGHGDAAAPMPATVIGILVETGQTVNAGDVVLKLEAMKMELPVRAPRAGVVSAIHCQMGELVQAGVVLVDIT